MATLTTGALYEFRVEEHLGTAVAALFPEFKLIHNEEGTTTLSGVLTDQAALHGVLARIRDLGLTLISVRRIPVSREP